MGTDIIDINGLKSQSTDSLSRFLTTIILSISGAKRLNSSLNISDTDMKAPSVFSEILNRVSINTQNFKLSLPDKGPFVICVPIVSGILEVISSYSAVFETTQRQDIRFVTSNENFAAINLFCNFFLDVKSFHTSVVFKSAVNYLKDGGALICFSRIGKDKQQYSELFSFPLKLSKYTNAPLFALCVKSDAPSSLASLLSFNNWLYYLLSIRRFIACSKSNVIVESSGPIEDDSRLNSFYKSMLDDGSLANLLHEFVPRGTNS